MSDFCASCGQPLPPARRTPKHYVKDNGIARQTKDQALCEKHETMAKEEGWKEATSFSVGA